MLPPDMQWMDWGGWRWVAMIFTASLFFYFGWDARGTRERTKRFIDRTDSKVALVEVLAGMKDPRDCPSIDDEIDAFAHMIDTAKTLCGDLSEDDKEGPDAC